MEQKVTWRGYLKEDFRLTHLKDKNLGEVAYHYHEFHKIVLFFSGNAEYVIEGKRYKLQPGDILFVCRGQIHRPEVECDEDYDRAVIWVNSGFLEENSSDGFNLLDCFEIAAKNGVNLYRPDAQQRYNALKLENDVEEELQTTDAGAKISANGAFLRLMVYLNRMMAESYTPTVQFRSDEKIEQVIRYINENLSQHISVDELAGKFFMSKYYFMRRFKEVTGYTVHNYILQKRLIKAVELIAQGVSVTEASYAAGFGDYSVFLRTFRKSFKMSPREFSKKISQGFITQYGGKRG